MRALDRIFRRRAISQAVKKLVSWKPASLFSAGEQGVYFDPNNTATLFEDAAGTIPTALERPVGRMLDLSGRGNHATSSSTARPTLTRRVNLLSNTEAFTKSPWATYNPSIQDKTSDTLDPLGGNNATKAIYGSVSAGFYVDVTMSTSYTYSIYAKKGTYDVAKVTVAYVTPSPSATFNLTSGVASGTDCTATMTSVGNGWWLCKIAFTASGSARIVNYCGTATGHNLYYFGADLRPANIGVGLPAYQRVGDTSVNAADYDTTGFPAWLRCSGGQSMVTPSIDFTGTNKVTAWAGLMKLSDAATAVVVESSTNSEVTSGVFGMFYPYGSSIPQPAFRSGGSVKQDSYPVSGYTAPIANVLSGIGDIFGDRAILRVNGTQAAISTADQGTGNYGNYSLHLFARNQASLFFNGLSGPIIVRGAQSSAAEIANAENWINAHQKVYQPPKLIFTALDSTGVPYPILDALVDSSGSTYTITATVLDSAGTSYNLI